MLKDNMMLLCKAPLNLVRFPHYPLTCNSSSVWVFATSLYMDTAYSESFQDMLLVPLPTHCWILMSSLLYILHIMCALILLFLTWKHFFVKLPTSLHMAFVYQENQIILSLDTIWHNGWIKKLTLEFVWLLNMKTCSLHVFLAFVRRNYKFGSILFSSNSSFLMLLHCCKYEGN